MMSMTQLLTLTSDKSRNLQSTGSPASYLNTINMTDVICPSLLQIFLPEHYVMEV